MNRKQRRAAAKGNSTASPSPAPTLDSLQTIFAKAVNRHESGRFAEAEDLYRSAIRINPNEVEPHYNLGVALAQLGRRQEAISAWRDALAIRPHYPRALNNLGMTLAELGQLGDAETALRTAVGTAPEISEIHSNLAGVLCQQGQWAEAEAEFHRALALHPAFPDAYNTMGTMLAEQRKLTQAIIAYRRALHLDPQHAKAHFNLSLALLASGNLSEGWAEHEWRWKGGARSLTARNFPRPAWQGEDLQGRRILLHGEQGFGDSLQFVRFAALIKARGAHVILEVPEALTRLLVTVDGVDEIVAKGRPLPRFDYHLPLLSAPYRLDIGLDGIPAAIPYLTIDRVQSDIWRERLESFARPWIGLVWAGDSRPDDPLANAIDRRRSIALTQLTPLLSVPDVTFVSLQKGPPAAQIASLPETLRPVDWTTELTDFADTAALTDCLDLVITVDTAVAHLAGALGKPLWIASRFDGCWRWLEGRDDSPWYPTARLFRQSEPATWGSVIDRMAEEVIKAGTTPAKTPIKTRGGV
jgi:Flp pilus assembly protein TadD